LYITIWNLDTEY